MLSRMAESLYWIGRYVERAEQTARITDVTFSHTLTMGSTPEAEARRARHWAALLDIVGERATFAGDGQPVDEDTVPTHLLFSAREPELDRRVHRPLARERAHDAEPARDRDVGGAEPLPPRRAAPGPAPAPRGRGRRERVALLHARWSSSASSCRGSPTRRCRARRGGTSCRPASSSSGRSGRRACSTSTTACSSATTPRAAIARRSPRRRPTCSRGRRCCARCRRTSRTTACRAGASGRAA